MDGGSSAANIYVSPELWRAIPVCFEYESIAAISRQPFTVKPAAHAFVAAFKGLTADAKSIQADFKQAVLILARGWKDKYGHNSMMRRHDGIAYPLHEDIILGGFLPKPSQQRKNASGTPVYCNVASEAEMWRELLRRTPNEKEMRFWRREFEGALSDDHTIIPRTALSARLTKSIFEEFPHEVRRQTQGRRYHSIGKKKPNCLTTWFNVLRAFDIVLPREIAKHRIPQELNKDLRQGKLDGVLADYSSSIVAIRREPMAEAIRRYKGTPEPYGGFVLAA